MVGFKTPVNRKYEINMEKFLKKYHILDVYFKKYPVCRHLHSSVDATLEVYNQMFQKELKLRISVQSTLKPIKSLLSIMIIIRKQLKELDRVCLLPLLFAF